MKLVFVFIMLVHGLIHVLGFAREFGLTGVKQLSKSVSFETSKYHPRLMGMLWLSACLLFLIAAICLFTDNFWWMIPAIAGVILSQTLIILNWSGAKWGSVLNVTILIAAIISVAEWSSLRNLNSEVKELFSKAQNEKLCVFVSSWQLFQPRIH